MADKLAVIAEIVPGGSGFHVVDAKNVAYKGDDLSKYLASNEEEVGDKADKEYVDTELEKKANVSDFNTYKTSNNAEVAKKANTSDVNTELGKKLNTSDFNTYKSVNDAAVAGKANKTYVDAELAKKANTSDLAGKANASDVTALQTAVNNKADGTTVSALAGRVSTNETNIAAANSRIDKLSTYVTPEMFGAVGNGTADDSTAIRNAINSSYSTIVMRNKYYTGDDTTFVIPRGKSIVIDGEIIAGAHGLVFTNMDYTTPHPGYTGNGNITICGKGRVYLNGHTNSENTQTTFRFAHAENIVIKDITIEDVPRYHAIELIAVKNAIIENVTFKGMSHANGLLQPSIQIEGAVSQEHQYGAIPFDGTGCRDITITGCYFCKGENTERLPIAISGGSAGDGEYHENITITNNRFYDISYCCVALDSFKNLIVSDNVAENIGMCFVGQTGVALNGVYNGLFSNNVINHVGYDVTISSSNRFVFMICNSHRVSIVGNRCNDGYMGAIDLEVCYDSYIANNVFESMLRYNVAKNTDSYRMLFLRDSQLSRFYSNKFMAGVDDNVSNYIATNWGVEKSGYLNEIRLNSTRYSSELRNLNNSFVGPDSLRSQLTSGENLDDYKTEGKYFCYSGAITTSLINRPPSVNYAGTLKVEILTEAGALLQTWISHDFKSNDVGSSGMWARTWTTSAWSSWRKIA